MADDKNNGQTPPPKIRIGVKPPVAGPGKLKSDTARVDLAASKPIDLDSASAGEPMNVRDVISRRPEAKSATSRISLNDSQSVAAGTEIPVAHPATSRIRLMDTQSAPGEFHPSDAEKDATVRVDLTGLVSPDQGAHSGTSPISVPDLGRVTADASKNVTARISVDLTQDEGDVAPPAGVGAPPPKTVRLSRPSAAPKTVVLKRPEAEGAAPKTVVLKRPDEVEDDKGATARIAVPEAAMDTAPSSQRKTIRIKRGDSAPAVPGEGGGKKLVIARPSVEPTAFSEEEIGEKIGVPSAPSVEPGVFFGILAIAATLVLGVLVYVLLAQTYCPQWNWPGKII